MTAELVYFSLWFLVTVASLWDMRRTHRYMQASLERIEHRGRAIAEFLDRDRR
jgi:hypothetical protein